MSLAGTTGYDGNQVANPEHWPQLLSTFRVDRRYQGRTMNSAPGPGESGIDAQRLIAKHQASIWRYLRALGCKPAEADDLTQETFLRFLQQPFAEVHPSATSAYLRKTAFHLLVSARRRDGRMNQSNDIDNLEDVWTQWHQDGE